ITPGTFGIYLIEAAPVLLGPMSPKAQQEALSVLTKLGVKIMLKTAVKDYVDEKVLLGNGETIATKALIWTSGVIGTEVKGLSPDKFGRSRRIIVDEYNKAKDSTNIFAIGDISLNTLDKRYPVGHPQLAQVAIQQGKLLAENLKRLEENRELKPFVYDDKGSMAIISKYKAVADLPKMFVKGFPAWFVWLFIHLLPIAGFRNKVNLALSWMWSFITDDPTLRLIIRPQRKEFPEEDHSKPVDPPVIKEKFPKREVESAASIRR
ncbi:NAD(P)/FAD-dependent oxidoreductase, partial [Chryseosolibacter indicus]